MVFNKGHIMQPEEKTREKMVKQGERTLGLKIVLGILGICILGLIGGIVWVGTNREDEKIGYDGGGEYDESYDEEIDDADDVDDEVTPLIPLEIITNSDNSYVPMENNAEQSSLSEFVEYDVRENEK